MFWPWPGQNWIEREGNAVLSCAVKGLLHWLAYTYYEIISIYWTRNFLYIYFTIVYIVHIMCLFLVLVMVEKMLHILKCANIPAKDILYFGTCAYIPGMVLFDITSSENWSVQNLGFEYCCISDLSLCTPHLKENCQVSHCKRRLLLGFQVQCCFLVVRNRMQFQAYREARRLRRVNQSLCLAGEEPVVCQIFTLRAWAIWD